MQGKRKPNGYKEKCGKQAFKRNISERKKDYVVFEEEFGHLEGDTIVGIHHKSAVIKAMNEKGVEVTEPTEIGTYTSWQLTKSGLAKLAARTNYLFTIVQTSDVYTIKQISGAVELGDSKTYETQERLPNGD
ncbi:hypothetical protein EfmGK923_09830 [Enterococcus faecium]|nr:hypothetical protein EfmGK923_09830 [Enterococcus faecium]